MNCYQEPSVNQPVTTPASGKGTRPWYTDTTEIDFSRFPIGMGYVPLQQWKQPYSLEQGFRRGTIFPELDLPFMMGRCR